MGSIATQFRSRRPRGYVLIVTLGLLVLAATLLTAIGQAAIRHTLEARLAQDRLQCHWGQVSCSKAILPNAEEILIISELTLHKPVAVYHTQLVLGGQTFTLIVSDEQAKANVNVMLGFALPDKSAVESHLRLALTGSGLPPAAIRLHVADISPQAPGQPAASAGASAVTQYVSGLGQIFDEMPPEKLLEGRTNVPFETVTCFGSGGTNMMRAPEAAMLLACGWSKMTRNDVEQIIEMRNARLAPKATSVTNGKTASMVNVAKGAPNTTGLDAVGTLLARAGVTIKDRSKVPLVSSSTCHSLWIIIGDSHSGSHYLAVSDESNPRFRRIQSFVW